MRRGSCKSYSITFCSPGRGYTHVYKQRIKSVHSVGMALMCRMFGLHLQHGGLDRGCEIEPCEIRMRVYIHTGLRCVCSPFFFISDGLWNIDDRKESSGWVRGRSSFPPPRSSTPPIRKPYTTPHQQLFFTTIIITIPLLLLRLLHH